MNNYLDGKEPTIKIVMLQEFENELGNIIKEYEKYNRVEKTENIEETV